MRSGLETVVGLPPQRLMLRAGDGTTGQHLIGARQHTDNRFPFRITSPIVRAGLVGQKYERHGPDATARACRENEQYGADSQIRRGADEQAVRPPAGKHDDKQGKRSPTQGPASPQPQQPPVGCRDSGRKDDQSISPEAVTTHRGIERSPRVGAVEQSAPPRPGCGHTGAAQTGMRAFHHTEVYAPFEVSRRT
jgi:hypothetical protein